MKGLPSNIDWAAFTLENRILDTEVPYRQVAEPWQLVIDKGIADNQRVYLQLARGHDKTDRYAWWSLLWLATTRASRGYCAGVDRDNAALFRDSSKKLKALHPDLFYAVEVQKNIVMNQETGSYIETISSDADSAYGLNFDLLIINDFHVWPDEKFWEVLWSACEKKPGIRIWMESNALTLGAEGAQWVAKFREWVRVVGTHLRDDPVEFRGKKYKGVGNWFYYVPRGFLATWQSSLIEAAQATLHPSAFARLINNEDSSGEESYLTPEQVEAITASTPLPPNNRGYTVTALDLGLKKDATAIATVQALPVEKGSPPRLNLLALDVFTGTVDYPVQLHQVEQTLFHHANTYHSSVILADPWNTQALIQKHPNKIVEWPFTTARIKELTQNLYRVVVDKQLSIYKNAGRAIQSGEEWTLQRELTNAVLKDCSYGQRVDHRSGGYSDRLMATGMCVHYLLSEMAQPRFRKEEQKNPPKDGWQSGKVIDSWIDEALHSGRRSSLLSL